MVSTSATVSIIVAVIVAGGAAIGPIYSSIRELREPDVFVNIRGKSPNITESILSIANYGTAPATNMSIIISAPKGILNITNLFSTAEVILPVHGNIVLKPGSTQTINQPVLEIQTPRLVQGFGSNITLAAFFNHSESVKINAVFDQGSVRARCCSPDLTTSDPLTTTVNYFATIFSYSDRGAYAALYLSYVLIVGAFIFLWWDKRNRFKKVMKQVLDSIMETRRYLRSNYINAPLRDLEHSHIKFASNNKQIKNVSDYLYIDDFYDELLKRNS